jgi:hypothetical protein
MQRKLCCLGACDPHLPVTLRADQGIDFVDLPNQPGPVLLWRSTPTAAEKREASAWLLMCNDPLESIPIRLLISPYTQPVLSTPVLDVHGLYCTLRSRTL